MGAWRGFALLLAFLAIAGSARAQRLLDQLRDAGSASFPQLKFSGQADLRFADGGPAVTPFTYNQQGDTGGVSTFTALDLHLMMSAVLSPRTRVFAKLLGTSDDGGHVDVESLTITTKLGYGWPVLDVGRFTSPFGKFSQRFLPMDNPLIGEPLIYTYMTDLPTNQVPASGADLVTQRGMGQSLQLSNYGATTTGQSLLTGGWNLDGLKFSGHRKKLKYAVAITNEPVSATSFLATHDNRAVTVHFGYKPDLPLQIGLSASHGAYLDHAIFVAPAFAPLHIGDFQEDTVGLDVDYAMGPFVFFGELVYKHWDSPAIPGGLDVTGWFVEPRYKVMPGLYVALRVDRLHFDTIPAGTGRAAWDFDATRVEPGLGLILERDLRVKASYEFNTTGGASPVDPRDNLFQVALIGAF